MAVKSNESVNITRAAMVTFSEYLNRLSTELESELTGIQPTVKALSDDEGLISGNDFEQTRGMYKEIGVNLSGATLKVKEASKITSKYIDVQQSISASGKRSTAEFHQAAVKVAQKLKSGASLK